MIKTWFSRNPLTSFWLVSLFGLALYSSLFLFSNLPPRFNELVLRVLYLAAVASPAGAATAVLRAYDPADKPGRIWSSFAYGFWAWFAAEVIWVTYNLLSGRVPSLNLADPFYLLGYFLLTFAIASQYRQMRYEHTLSERSVVAWMWFFILLVSGLIYFFIAAPTAASAVLDERAAGFLNVVYGTGDMTLALAAFLMLTRFQGGALGRPWWGFIILALADIFYGFLTQGAAYDFQVMSGKALWLASDLIYMLAYLVIAYSFLRQYALLRFGPHLRHPSSAR